MPAYFDWVRQQTGVQFPLSLWIFFQLNLKIGTPVATLPGGGVTESALRLVCPASVFQPQSCFLPGQLFFLHYRLLFHLLNHHLSLHSLLSPPLATLSSDFVGLVDKASTLRLDDLGFDSLLRHGEISRSSHTSYLNIGTPVATLPGALHYRVILGTGWPRVSIL